jgi:WD40 repeat protein
VAAGVAVVLTIVVSAHFLGSPGGRRLASQSAYSRDFIPRPVAGNLSSVAFSPDGETLAAGASGGPETGKKTGPQASGTTYLWNVHTTEQIAKFSPGGGAEAFSPDGKVLAAAGGPANSRTYLWDLTTQRRIATLPDRQNSSVDAVAFSANGRILATDDANGTVYVWLVPRGHGIPAGYHPASVSIPGNVNANAVAFSQQGTTLAMAGSDGQAYLWSAAKSSFTRSLNTPGNSEVTSVAFSPDGLALAASDMSGVTYVWNLASRGRRAFADPDSLGIESICFSPDGKWLASGDVNGKTYLWNMTTGKLALTLNNPKGRATGPLSPDQRSAVFSVAFSPSGTTLATTDTNGHAYLWKVP